MRSGHCHALPPHGIRRNQIIKSIGLYLVRLVEVQPRRKHLVSSAVGRMLDETFCRLPRFTVVDYDPVDSGRDASLVDVVKPLRSYFFRNSRLYILVLYIALPEFGYFLLNKVIHWNPPLIE